MTYAFHTQDKLCFILDLMNGGDLHYHLSQHGVFSEKDVRFYAAEVLLGKRALEDLNAIASRICDNLSLMGCDMVDFQGSDSRGKSESGDVCSRQFWYNRSNDLQSFTLRTGLCPPLSPRKET